MDEGSCRHFFWYPCSGTFKTLALNRVCDISVVETTAYELDIISLKKS